MPAEISLAPYNGAMAVRFQDYYQTLGVNRGASQEEIRRAYRKLARQYHPDVNKSPQAEERFRAVNEAYEVLGDPEKRRKYDQLGANWKAGQEFRAPPGWEDLRYEYGGRASADGFSFSPGGFSDFFQMFFGRDSGFSRGSAAGFDLDELFCQAQAGPQQTRRRRSGGLSGDGGDTEARVEVTLEEAMAGGRRQLQLRFPGGQTRTLDVKIPPGVRDGSRIRLRGQGADGEDLLLTVRLAPHPRFEVVGSDLVTDLPVSPWEAALGAKVTLPIIGGTVTMTVPAGSQTGQKLRLRGKGLPIGHSGHGDLFVRIKIVNPPKLSNAQRQLFEQLRAQSSFDPRQT